MIGNNTILGFFEAIVKKEKFKMVLSGFWHSVPKDSGQFRNVIRDKDSYEISYTIVDPTTEHPREVSEKRTSKFSTYLKEMIDRQYDDAIAEIDEFVEKEQIAAIEPFIKYQANKIEQIKNNLEDSQVMHHCPTVKITMQQLKTHVHKLSDVFGIKIQSTSPPPNTGRPPKKDDKFFTEAIESILNDANKAEDNSKYYNCIHRAGNKKGEANYRQIAKMLFNDYPGLNDLYSSNEGLEKRAKKIVQTYELS